MGIGKLGYLGTMILGLGVASVLGAVTVLLDNCGRSGDGSARRVELFNEAVSGGGR